jgi:hypothetical protein
MAKKAPAKPPAKRKPRAKKPVVVEPLTDGLQIIKPVPEEIISFNAGQVLTGGYLRKRLNLNGQIETYSLAPIETRPAKPEKKPADDGVEKIKIYTPSEPIAWRSWLVGGAKAAALIVAGAVAGVYAAGGMPIGPGPVVYTDSLAESHTNDRASQVRILREYLGKTFASEPEAQKWLNEQRIAARPTDWIPYTDELGVAADAGPDAVKAFADKLEGNR